MNFTKDFALKFLLALISIGLLSRVTFAADPEAVERKSPASEVSISADRHGLEIQFKNAHYEFTTGNLPQESIDLFNQLSLEQQSKFLSRRAELLNAFAKYLHGMGLISGLGSLVGGKIRTLKNNFEDRRRTEPDSALLPEILLSDAELEERGAKVRLSLQHRRQITLQGMLSGIDAQMWSQSPLVISNNEIFIQGALGVYIEAGTQKAGRGGGYEIGLGLGFNFESKSFLIDIFRNSESFKDTVMPGFAVATGNGKLGMRFAKGAPNTPLNIKGTSYYPPAIPGFVTTTPYSFTIGASSGVGFPPLSELITFRNEHHHKVLVRLLMSPLTKGFLRVQTGISSPISTLTNRIRSSFGGRLCGKAYVN
jgi:hypothetical protein